MAHTTVKDLPESERPYERFLALGPEALSDAELLAIIIKNGTREMTALELARKLLGGGEGSLLNLHDMSIEDLMRIRGIGQVKAIQLKAVAELSVRLARTDRSGGMKLNDPGSIAHYYMEELRHRREEVVMAAFFDGKYSFLGDCTLASGSSNCAYIKPAEMFRKALAKHAVQIVLLHNHPSGDPTPSGDDRNLTRQIVDAGNILGINIADHIVIGDRRYYSFCENGAMPT